MRVRISGVSNEVSCSRHSVLINATVINIPRTVFASRQNFRLNDRRHYFHVPSESRA